MVINYKEDFEKANREFIWIYGQYKEVSSVSKELEKITKGKTFRICNQAIYNMYVSQYKFLYVNILSFCEFMFSRVGPLSLVKDQLIVNQNRGIEEFTFFPLSKEEEEDLILQQNFTEQIHYSHKKKIIDGLPKCKLNCKQRLCVCDLDFFMKEFRKVGHTVKKHRDFFAHFYEIRSTDKNIDIEDAKKALDRINELIGMLTWFADIKWSSDITLYTCERRTACDIVDQILCGTLSQIPFETRYDVDRDFRFHVEHSGDRLKFYSLMHEIHDKLSKEDQEKVSFNDKTPTNGKGIFFSNSMLNFEKREIDWEEFPDERPYRVRPRK